MFVNALQLDEQEGLHRIFTVWLWEVRVLNLYSLKIGTGLLSWINTFWLKRLGFRLGFLKLVFTVSFWVVSVWSNLVHQESRAFGNWVYVQCPIHDLADVEDFFNHPCLQLLGPEVGGPVKWFCDACKNFHLEFRLVIFIILLVDLDLLTSYVSIILA